MVVHVSVPLQQGVIDCTIPPWAQPNVLSAEKMSFENTI
jgi:hypothetical protein